MYLFDVAYYFCFITTFVVENNTVFAKTQIFLTPFMVIVQTSSACRDLLLIQQLNKQQILGMRSLSALLPRSFG